MGGPKIPKVIPPAYMAQQPASSTTGQSSTPQAYAMGFSASATPPPASVARTQRRSLIGGSV